MATRQELAVTLTDAIEQFARTATEANSYSAELERAQAALTLAQALKELGLAPQIPQG